MGVTTPYERVLEGIGSGEILRDRWASETSEDLREKSGITKVRCGSNSRN